MFSTVCLSINRKGDDKFMKLSERKRKIKAKLTAIGTIISLISMKSNMCFANNGSSGIGTAEVEAATENIERVITSIAMPLGRCFDFCKYCCCSFENDSKCKQPTKEG